VTRLALLVSTVGGIGYAPVAPGTFGSAAGLVLLLGVRAAGWPALAELALIALLFAIGSWSGSVAEQHFGRTDPGYIVLDEVVGMLITLWLLPVNTTGAVTGFLLFRVLDILKPFPARRIERLHGGLGVMADDALVGIYGNLFLRLLIWWVPGWLT